MEVSVQLHAPSALSLGTKPPLHQTWWGPVPFLCCGEEKKSLAFTQGSNPTCPVHSLYAILYSYPRPKASRCATVTLEGKDKAIPATGCRSLWVMRFEALTFSRQFALRWQ